MSLHKVSQLIHQFRPLRRIHPGPRSIIECLSRGFDGCVDIFFAAFLNDGEDGLVGGVERFEGFPGEGFYELAVYEEVWVYFWGVWFVHFYLFIEVFLVDLVLIAEIFPYLKLKEFRLIVRPHS